VDAQVEEQTSQREEGASSSATGEGASSEKTLWGALTVSMRDRVLRFVGTAERIFKPTLEEPVPSMETLVKAKRAAEAFVNDMPTEDAVALLFAYEKTTGCDSL
jgi:hypothetical protein